MCDFKPGDEVMCVDAGLQWGVLACPLIKGAIYTVRGLVKTPAGDGSRVSVMVDVRSSHLTGAWSPHRFRKVQRRDLSAWLKTSIGNTDKLDKRQKVKA